ncbi:MAG: toprim domain-containing protein [Cyanobacteria bacterium HKST-UBA03]|nr:toprim domain-containing protein [Cyanobacteria bacterium HKST-UBA03]
MDVKQLAATLAQNADACARFLLPNGKREGGYWVAGSVDGEQGHSLQVCLSGNRAGIWADFAGQDKGDLVELWRQVKRLSLPDAIREASEWAGVTPIHLSQPKARHYDLPAPQDGEKIGPEVSNYLTAQRGMTTGTLEAFGVKQQGRSIQFDYCYPAGQVVHRKWVGLDRPEGKKQIRSSKNTKPILFGWQALDPNTRTVYLTEGELDAMSLHQLGFPALSVPNGATANHWIDVEWENLARFDDIYIVFDGDEPGQKGAMEVAQRLGVRRCRVAKLPTGQDVNDLLVSGSTSQAIGTLLAQAACFGPEELKPVEAFRETLIEHMFYSDDSVDGLLLPWASTHGLFRLRKSELVVLTGVNGHGKSQALGHMALGLINQGERVCIASLEMPVNRLLERLARQAAGVRTPSEAAVNGMFDWMQDHFWVYDKLGKEKTESILEAIRYGFHRHGITTFIIDSLLKCGLDEDGYNEQKLFVEALADLKNELGLTIILVAHPRKKEDETNPVGKMDIRGSGAISDLADSVLTIWRNKKKEEQLEVTPDDAEIAAKPDARLFITKNRNGEFEGGVPLWFDRDSFQYTSFRREQVKYYVSQDMIDSHRQENTEGENHA